MNCTRKAVRTVVVALVLIVVASLPKTTSAEAAGEAHKPVQLRAFGVPSPYALGLAAETDRRVLMAFRQAYPWIEPVSPTGLVIPGGGRTMDMVPMMQIAGDIAPDVLYVNFRYSQSYIAKKLLYALDRDVEQMAGVSLPDGSVLSTTDYVDALRKGAHWDLIERRVLPQCWDVIRRDCPYGDDCPYRRKWGLGEAASHQHVFAFPIGPTVMALQYDRTIFAQHADDGIDMRAPRDWEEMLRWAKLMTRPDRNEYGLKLRVEVPAWEYLTFLYSAGGEAVRQDAGGNWVCTLDSEAAVDAAYFYARLRLEPIHYGDGRLYRGVTGPSTAAGGTIRHGMVMASMDDRFLSNAEDLNKGFGLMPAGPTGLHRSEFNAKMVGLFSGLIKDPARQQAAWDYVKFYDGPESRKVQTQAMVEAGLGMYVRPALLRQFNTDGQYDSLLRQIPPDLEETYRVAFAGGVPEPYGKNCQYVYAEMNKPLGTILHDPTVLKAIDGGNPELARPVIRQILKEATTRINQKMLGNLPPAELKQREWVAWTVVGVVVLTFGFVLRRVVSTFRAPRTFGTSDGGWQIYRYRWAYVLLAPALISIALWAYWPLASGSAIAFQDYSVTGESQWVGVKNFADALYDAEFWHSLGVSLTYAGLYMVFGFGTPIALAFLLQEVPAGSVLFRTLFYLPAVLSGAVVIFLWKGFYSPDGLVNQILNGLIVLANHVPGVHFETINQSLLENPTFALFLCLLPTIWAGMGPGCLIYLAALKTIPEELYEAADLDGAGIGQKVFRVALPSISALVMINFIGAMIGAVRGASGFILAMTGGGPYGQEGGATEVIGLKLFYTSFGELAFGRGAAMAWILGSMLIGFTVIQLRRLRNLEFKTTGKVG